MKLTLIYSNTSVEAHRRLYERLKKIDEPTAKHVFLVPDRFTLGVERDLIDNVFPEGFSRVDVASFTRFAIKHVGKKIKSCLSKEGTVVLLTKILDENSDFKYFKKVGGYNFAKELFAAIASLRSAGITSEDIERVCAANSGKLWDKLSDTALIMKRYDRYIKENYSDTITRIDSLIEYVKTGAFSDVNFYVLGFNMYSAQQLSLLKSLSFYAKSLTVAAVKSDRFYNPSKELEPLRLFCEENGVPVTVEQSFEVLDGCFGMLRDGVFGGKPIKISTDRVRLFKESTPFEEFAAVAREILYLVRKENYRYRDIAVICNDGQLIPYIRETFARFDVPCFVDEGYAVTDGITVRYILYLMEAMDELSPEKVLRFARHPFNELSRKELTDFKNYCIKYNIKYDRFLSPLTLGNFAEAEEIRKKIVGRFVLPEKGTVKDYCERIGEILEEFSDKTESFADGNARLAFSAHTEKFSLLLEEMKGLISEKTLSVGEMCGLIKSAAADLKTVLRPDNYDVVFVGNTDESRFSGIKIMFVTDACDGMFPKKSGDGLIFSMADNEAMKQNGLAVFPTPIDRNAFEEFVFYDLMAKGVDYLYVSYATSDSGGNAVFPGDAYKEITYLTDSDERPLVSYHGLNEEGEFNYFLATEKNAYREYVTGTVPEKYRYALGRYLIKKGFLIDTPLPDENGAFVKCFDINENGEYVTSISQLENYFVCPFRHFMRYCLKAKEPDDLVLKPSALGTAIHNVLEKFIKEYADRIDKGENLDAEAERVISAEFAKPDYESFYTDPLSAHILKTTAKECKRLLRVLSDNIRASEFKPQGLEVAFGYRDDDNKILIDVDGRIFRLRGKVDRVDGKDDYVVVIDYKTGAVEDSLSSVYVGQKIQLYAYLDYFMKSGKRPAGVFYLPIKSGARKGGTVYKMKGQILNDGEVFRALDTRCVSEGKYSGPTVDFNVTVKDGEVKFNNSKNILKLNDFENIVDYVGKLTEQGIREILDGCALKKPLEGSCKNCPYKSMCGVRPERKKPDVSASNFNLNGEPVDKVNGEEEI